MEAVAGTITNRNLPSHTVLACSHCGFTFSDEQPVWVRYEAPGDFYGPTGQYHTECRPFAELGQQSLEYLKAGECQGRDFGVVQHFVNWVHRQWTKRSR